MNNIKKGFTFAELMISLVVIAVITAILYPTISELAPNNNKHLFKSAYKTIEMVVSDIANNTDSFPNGDTAPATLCAAFASRLNLSTNNNSTCQANNTTTGEGENEVITNRRNSFQTTNGMRWHFDTSADPAGVKIYIDVNASNNKTDSNATQIVSTDDNPIWAKGSFDGNSTIQDTFYVIVDNQGKIVEIDSIGRQHLLDETEN